MQILTGVTLSAAFVLVTTILQPYIGRSTIILDNDPTIITTTARRNEKGRNTSPEYEPHDFFPIDGENGL
jgi:hypothetical protein